MSEELTLLPCPACGNATLDCAQGMFCHFITCEECGLSIRQSEREDTDIIKAWNTLPRALVWTKESPTQEGFFFAANEDFSVITAVLITNNGDRNFVLDVIGWDIPFHLEDVGQHYFVHFAGPIPMPKEPTE